MQLTDQGSQVQQGSSSSELEKECERLRAQLDAIAGLVHDGLQIIAPTGEILLINPAAEKMLGYTQEERELPWLERARVLQITAIDGKPFPVEETPGRRALMGETVRDVVMALNRPPDRTVWVSLNAAPIRTLSGEFLGVLLAFSDVTALQEREERKASGQEINGSCTDYSCQLS